MPKWPWWNARFTYVGGIFHFGLTQYQAKFWRKYYQQGEKHAIRQTDRFNVKNRRRTRRLQHVRHGQCQDRDETRIENDHRDQIRLVKLAGYLARAKRHDDAKDNQHGLVAVQDNGPDDWRTSVASVKCEKWVGRHGRDGNHVGIRKVFDKVQKKSDANNNCNITT